MGGSFSRVMPLFVWVAIDITLWGFITKYLNTVSNSGFNFVPVVLGAVLLWDFFVRVMHGVTTTFLEDVWNRNFLNMFSSPLTVNEYVCGLVLTSVISSIVGLLVMLGLATTFFGLSFAAYGLLIIPFILVIILFGIAIGIFGSGVVLWFGPASEWFVWPIPAIISPFVGVFYPISTLPGWMQLPSYILPPAYVFEDIRLIMSGNQVSVTGLAFSMLMAVGYIILAGYFFNRVYKRAVRTGLIARYSAETVS